jgi:hypothetical protein
MAKSEIAILRDEAMRLRENAEVMRKEINKLHKRVAALEGALRQKAPHGSTKRSLWEQVFGSKPE